MSHQNYIFFIFIFFNFLIFLPQKSDFLLLLFFLFNSFVSRRERDKLWYPKWFFFFKKIFKLDRWSSSKSSSPVCHFLRLNKDTGGQTLYSDCLVFQGVPLMSQLTACLSLLMALFLCEKLRMMVIKSKNWIIIDCCKINIKYFSNLNK